VRLNYCMKRERASRAGMAPRYLAPPLTLVRRTEATGIIWHRPFVDDGIEIRQAQGKAIATDEAGTLLWTDRKKGEPALVCDQGVLIWRAGTAELLDPLSGRANARLPGRACIETLAIGDVLVGMSYAKGSNLMLASSLQSRMGLWTYRPDTKGPQNISGIFCADERGVYLGLSDGALVGLSLSEGKEMWRQESAGMQESGKPRVAVKGFLTAYGNSVIVRYATNVAAVSTRDGRVLWMRDIWGTLDGYLYGDRYYVTTDRGGYHVLDPKTGKVLLSADLLATLPKAVRSSPIMNFAPMLVSETHVFVGTREGYLLAFERETGRYAWHFLPKNAGVINYNGSYFSSVNGRFYYADMSFAEYCLEEETPTDTVLKERRARAEAEGRSKPVGRVAVPAPPRKAKAKLRGESGGAKKGKVRR
jgi:outer membrane protein assembly factor BamB